MVGRATVLLAITIIVVLFMHPVTSNSASRLKDKVLGEVKSTSSATVDKGVGLTREGAAKDLQGGREAYANCVLLANGGKGQAFSKNKGKMDECETELETALSNIGTKFTSFSEQKSLAAEERIAYCVYKYVGKNAKGTLNQFQMKGSECYSDYQKIKGVPSTDTRYSTERFQQNVLDKVAVTILQEHMVACVKNNNRDECRGAQAAALLKAILPPKMGVKLEPGSRQVQSYRT